MKEIIIPILTFLGGFYVKQFFDNRDLRRKILEPVFEEFEKNIIYIQTEWRNIQVNLAIHLTSYRLRPPLAGDRGVMCK